MTNCEACNGTGYMIVKHRRCTCIACDGRGEVSRIKELYVYVPTITFKKMEEQRRQKK